MFLLDFLFFRDILSAYKLNKCGEMAEWPKAQVC